MARPAGGYKLADGTRVPGVTTITGRFKDSGALIHWAWKMGRDGKDYEAMRDSAATAGTLAHALIEAQLFGLKPIAREQYVTEIELYRDASPEERELADRGFEAYQRWAEQSQVEILAAEEPLVSEKVRFGGTPDAIAKVGGKIALLDFKTGGLYAEHLAQLGGYDELISECHGLEIEEYHLLRLGKEDASFHHHSWIVKNLPEAREMFRVLRVGYDLDQVLKRRVR